MPSVPHPAKDSKTVKIPKQQSIAMHTCWKVLQCLNSCCSLSASEDNCDKQMNFKVWQLLAASVTARPPPFPPPSLPPPFTPPPPPASTLPTSSLPPLRPPLYPLPLPSLLRSRNLPSMFPPYLLPVGLLRSLLTALTALCASCRCQSLTRLQ